MFHFMQVLFFVTLDLVILVTLIYKTRQIVQDYMAATKQDRLRRAYERNDRFMESLGMEPNERTIARRGVK